MALAMAATALTGCGGGDSAGGDDSNKTYKVAYIARAQSDLLRSMAGKRNGSSSR